ncbi:hypothetical protein EB118_13280 [bacterium]|nr:hypothetical protein [bacterium]NBX97836.1 hypothetical protein [bacterium]NDC95065.1 hypothetical protein [bacterium]NDD84785.1 hypothetical protein [bacterium]NDG31025.1 hypothetical protein [bacterium]
MATSHELQTLRSLALDEQYSAAIEQRLPNRDLLDSLGRLVLPDYALVVCEADYAYRQDYDNEQGYFITKIEEPVSIVGRFGGFFSRAVEVLHDDKIVSVEKVSYHIMNDRYMDTGFLFPVEITHIEDMFDKFGNDPIFQELTHELGQSKIDIKKIASIIETKVYGSKAPLYHAVYVQQMVTPADLFSWIQSEVVLPIGFDDEYKDQIVVDNVGIHMSPDHCFGLVQLDEKSVRLIIMQNSVPSLVAPVTFINGWTPTDLLQSDQAQ